MSYWSYVFGVIEVQPLGRTQPEMQYVLDTVLEHLPRVTGSERNMKVHVVRCAGHSGSSSHNEFGECMWYRQDADNDGFMRTQDHYMLLLEARLRDRMFSETLREFNKWLNRLAKRLLVEDIMVRISGQDKVLVIDDREPYYGMFEWPSWGDGISAEPAWAEYLLWDAAKDSEYPMLLAYKYYHDPENDAEVERRRTWVRSKYE